jgi:hypothetical protein
MKPFSLPEAGDPDRLIENGMIRLIYNSKDG